MGIKVRRAKKISHKIDEHTRIEARSNNNNNNRHRKWTWANFGDGVVLLFYCTGFSGLLFWVWGFGGSFRRWWNELTFVAFSKKVIKDTCELDLIKRCISQSVFLTLFHSVQDSKQESNSPYSRLFKLLSLKLRLEVTKTTHFERDEIYSFAHCLASAFDDSFRIAQRNLLKVNKTCVFPLKFAMKLLIT